LENAGIDHMAYMTRTGKCESKIVYRSVNMTTIATVQSIAGSIQ